MFLIKWGWEHTQCSGCKCARTAPDGARHASTLDWVPHKDHQSVCRCTLLGLTSSYEVMVRQSFKSCGFWMLTWRKNRLFHSPSQASIHNILLRTQCAGTCLCVSVPPCFKVQAVLLTCTHAAYVWLPSKNFPLSKHSVSCTVRPCLTETPQKFLLSFVGLAAVCLCFPSCVPQQQQLTPHWKMQRCQLENKKC